MTKAECQTLAEDYLREVVRCDDLNLDAFDRLLTLLRNDPATAWEVVANLLLLCTSDVELAQVGAGPLEDILVAQPETYVKRAITIAKRDRRMREALRYVVIGKGDIPAGYLTLLNSWKDAG